MNVTISLTTYKNFSLICIALLTVMFNAKAQTQKFQKVYGGYSYDYGNDLLQTPDTGYLLLCTSNSFSGSSDIYLLKVDKLGAYEWQHTYGGTEIEGACKIKYTQDGNIAMAGHTSSYLNSTYDFYLVKATMNGDTIWTKHYGTNEWDFANSMDTCSDGGFILAGKTYDTGNAYSDMLIIKTDADGLEQWRKKIGGNKDDVANSIIAIPDGYLICGTTESIGAGEKDIYVVKIDLNGDFVWEKTLGGSENDEGESIIMDNANNELIVGGNTKSFGIPDYFNFYLQKLSLTGNVLPVNFISTNYSNYYLTEIVLRPNGNIMLCGDVDMLNSTDFMLLEYDNGFNFIIGTSYGGPNRETPNSLINTLDNGICAIGLTASVGNGLDNIFLVKCDTLVTNVGPLQSFVNIQDFISDLNKENLIFPNPSSGVFNLKLAQNYSNIQFSDFSKFKVNIINSIGQKTLLKNVFVNKFEGGVILHFNEPGICNGVYHLTVEYDGKVIETKYLSIIK